MSTNILKSLKNKTSLVGKNTKLYVALLAAVFALSQQDVNAQVGINESNPQQILDVNGAIRINDSSSIALA